MTQVDRNTYQVGNWTLTFGNRFSFTVTNRTNSSFRSGVYYYTGQVDLSDSPKLPRPVLNALIGICKQRHKAGLMPNKR